MNKITDDSMYDYGVEGVDYSTDEKIKYIRDFVKDNFATYTQVRVTTKRERGTYSDEVIKTLIYVAEDAWDKMTEAGYGDKQSIDKMPHPKPGQMIMRSGDNWIDGRTGKEIYQDDDKTSQGKCVKVILRHPQMTFESVGDLWKIVDDKKASSTYVDDGLHQGFPVEAWEEEAVKYDNGDSELCYVDIRAALASAERRDADKKCVHRWSMRTGTCKDCGVKINSEDT